MQKVILYISPKIVNSNTEADFVRVDLMEEELITLTQVIQDVQDIEKLFTDYSKTFNLPASKTNNKIFKYWFNPDVNNFNSQVFSSARIELNHFEFKTGQIQLNEVVMKDQKPSMYKVTFFGETVDFKNAINEDQLSNLAWLSNFDFQEQPSGSDNVKEGLKNGLNFTVDGVAYNDAIIYPLITHTGSYIYSSNSADFTNPYNINTQDSDQTRTTKRGVLKEDLKPAITIRIILKAIEQQYGITFKTGEFFDTTALNNLYLWLHREKGKIPLNGYWNSYNSYSRTAGDAQLENSGNAYGYYDINQGIFYWDSFPDTSFSPAYQDDTTITVTITPLASFTNVLYDANIINANTGQVLKTVNQISGTQTVILKINKDGSNGAMRLSDVNTHPAKIITTLNANEVIEFNYSIKIDRYVKYSEFLNLNWSPIIIDLSATFAPTTATQTPTSGDIVILDQVPKLKVKDFLNGLFKQFNLTVFLNSQKEIVVQTLDSFYAGGETQDLTEYVKTDTHSVGNSIPFSEVDFEYQDPKTILAQKFKLLNNQKYGELNYRVDVSKKNIYQIQLPFSQMLFERLKNIGVGNSSTQIQVGTSIDEELNPSIGAPLIFYGIRIVDADDAINYVSGTSRPEGGGLAPTAGTKSILDTYYIPSVCNEVGNSSTPPTHNLNFGSEINTYTLTDYNGNNNSLFQTYYQNYVTRVFNTRTRLFKFDAVLPLKVLLTLTLDDLVIIGTREYTINKMTTKLQSGETSFELLNEPS
jgi:hypothetical protein